MTKDIIAAIDGEIGRLQAAKRALEGAEEVQEARRARASAPRRQGATRGRTRPLRRRGSVKRRSNEAVELRPGRATTSRGVGREPTGKSVSDRVARLLTHRNGLSTGEIAGVLSLSRTTVQTALKQLERDSRARKTGSGPGTRWLRGSK